MKVSYGKGVATHTAPESCGVTRESIVEALTGVGAGWVLSRERAFHRGADAERRRGRPPPAYRYREIRWDRARPETLYT
jgi:hypothetical protein